MAHWSDNHTKKDIVNFYEGELATLRAENERLREALNKVWNYSETGSMIESVCEEALK